MASNDEIYEALADKMFSDMDKNSDGKVTKDEVNKALSGCGHDHCKESADKFFEALDSDKNGCLSKEELLDFLKKVVVIKTE